MRHVVVGRAIKSGLSSMTEDWAHEMRPQHVIVIDSGRGTIDTSQLPKDIPFTVVADREWREWPWLSLFNRFFATVDFVVGFETWYRGDFVSHATSSGLKTVMFPMWECSPRDVYDSTVTLNVTQYDHDRNSEGIRCEWPISGRVIFRVDAGARRWPPRRFVCNTGYGALFRRNNTEEFIAAAAALEGTGAEAIVRCIRQPKVDPKSIPSSVRIEGLVEARRDLYRDADVIVCPIGIEGLSLPIWEAVANGIPTVVMDLHQYRRMEFPYRVPVGEETRHGFTSGREVIARPDVKSFGQLLRDLAHGRYLGPPRHPTWSPHDWSAFRQFWKANVEPKLI